VTAFKGRTSVPVRASTASSVTAKLSKKAQEVVKQSHTAGIAAFVSLTTALPAHADTLEDTGAFLKAFWEFRTGDPASFFALTVLPIAGPYLIFQVLIKQKVEVRLNELKDGGWIEFMAERGLDAETLTLQQLNAFVAAAEKDLLDDGMVTEFVRQLGLDEKWVKSTIDVEDPRLEKAKQRARAEKILEMQAARAKETANN
jgi:hypothetical protein|tara:strand:- start:6630 stop:7232 length:603 start_codon:yes stop_codon:yes gene_type:complete